MVVLALSVRYAWIDSTQLVIGLATYVFLYHPMILGLRLLQKNKIKGVDFWKNFIPTWNSRYYSAAYFEK
jgi:hypothetical protein